MPVVGITAGIQVTVPVTADMVTAVTVTADMVVTAATATADMADMVTAGTATVVTVVTVGTVTAATDQGAIAGIHMGVMDMVDMAITGGRSISESGWYNGAASDHANYRVENNWLRRFVARSQLFASNPF